MNKEEENRLFAEFLRNMSSEEFDKITSEVDKEYGFDKIFNDNDGETEEEIPLF